MNAWQINKTDTSYRFLTKWNFSIPHTFCAYYRKVALLSFRLTLAGFGIASVPFMIVVVCAGINPLYVLDSHFSWAGLGLCLSFYAGVLTLCVAITILILKIQDWYYDYKLSRNERNGHVEVKKQPSILVTYYKAYKQKLCPLIEIVGEYEED